MKKSEWLPAPKIFKDHSKDIKRFVDCYLVFNGVAGKCFTCYVVRLCKKLNKDAKAYAKLQMEIRAKE